MGQFQDPLPISERSAPANIRGLTVTRNIIASAISRFWMGGLQFVFTPVYLRLLGPDAYGLLGFYGTLLVSLLFLDQCISPVLSRELAKLGVGRNEPGAMRDLLRSLEILSFATALALGAAVWLAAPLIARRWIQAGSLSPSEVTAAIRMMGLVVACQWPIGLYGSGFVGLHRQDVATRIRVVIFTLQWGGAALLLWLVKASIVLLFAWQSLNFLLLDLLLAVALWRLLPPAPGRPRFDPVRLRSVWRFALGTLAIAFTASFLTQADKLLVSRYVPLGEFAAYSLAFTLAGLISILIAQPIGSALMPHFSRLTGAAHREELAREYHRWTQLIAALAVPAAGALATFGPSLIRLWLGRSSPLVEPVGRLLPWIVIGTMLNTFMMVQISLQLAHGWTRLSIYKNSVALAILLPILVIGIPRYGVGIGAATWLALNLGLYLFETTLMHRRLLPGEQWRWWGQDTLAPMIVTALLFWLASHLLPAGASPWWALLLAVLTASLALGAMLAILPHARAQAAALWALWIRLSS